jgi:hypothetical protein
VVNYVMASPQQISANQQNASLSTAPRTPVGKARSSRNALKTGMFSKQLLLPDENGKEFDRLRTDLLAEWQPVGPTETQLVDRLTGLFWRQGRLYRGEVGLYAIYRQAPEGLGGVATALAKSGSETEAFTRLQQMDSAIERSIGITIRLLQQLQKDRGQRKGLAAPPPAAPAPSPLP